MEELTVVVFYMEETWGRAEKRIPWHFRAREPWQYHVEWEQEEIPHLCRVYLPERMQKKKEWTKDGFTSYMEGLPIPGESADVYYYYTKAAATFLHRKTTACPRREHGFYCVITG